MASWGVSKRVAAWAVSCLMVAGCTSSPVDATSTTSEVDAVVSTTAAPTTEPEADASLPPIYQSADEIVALLDDTQFACSDIDVEPVEAVLALEFPGVVGMANCWEGDTPDPGLTGYHAVVFDSAQNRRTMMLGLLPWACIDAPTYPYVYGPNWLLIPFEDRTPYEPVQQASEIISGNATTVDCAAVWNAPDDLDPDDLDLEWYQTATGEVELPEVPPDLLPETPPLPPATGLPPANAPHDGVVVDGLLVAVGDGTRVVWQLPDPGAVEITGDVFGDWLQRIIATPNGLFVAVGRSTGEPIGAYSTDGTSWETTEFPGGDRVKALALGPLGLVAVGRNQTSAGPMLWKSDDGQTWQANGPVLRDLTSDDLGDGLGHVAANQRGYLVVNAANEASKAWFSEDLFHWSPGFEFKGRVHDLVVHEDQFVALVDTGDDSSGIWVSEDGQEWIETATPDELDLTHPGLDKRALASGPTGLLAITVNNRIAVSPDGITWTPIETPGILADVWLPSVVGGPDGWYVFAEIGQSEAWGIFFSADGANWNRVGSG